MSNNDILRRIRYIFNYSNPKIISIFELADCQVTLSQVNGWLKKEEDAGFLRCSDMYMALFLNGLIYEKRGKRDGAQRKPEKRLNNNLIILKLKIALNMRSDEVVDVMKRADFRISEHELSAFFRKPDHKHYRECKDQILRNFLLGLQLKYRP